MCKYNPDESILTLSKKFFGKIPGSILNALFLIQFIFYVSIRCSLISNLMRVYFSYFLSPQTLISIIVIVSAVTCLQGLEVLGRVNQTLSFLTIVIILLPAGALTFGSLSNLLPVMGSGLSNAFNNTVNGTYQYSGFEMILLLYPFLKDKSKLKAAGIRSVLITTAIFVWVTFITVYYLGIDIVPKYLWPVISTTKALNLRAIRNFSNLFLFLWVIITIRNISISYYAAVHILNNLLVKVSSNSFSIYLIPVVYFISSGYGNEVMSRAILLSFAPALTIYNIVFTSAITLFVYIREGKKS
jgi:spore germination protein (amino acid permease)